VKTRSARSIRGWWGLLGVAAAAPFAPARSAAPVSGRLDAVSRADGTAALAMTDGFLEFTAVAGKSYEVPLHQ
jgi:hypothetical protein